MADSLYGEKSSLMRRVRNNLNACNLVRWSRLWRKTIGAGSAAFVLMFGMPSSFAIPDGKTQGVTPAQNSSILPELWSGYRFASPKTRAIQDDDFENPGFLWLELGKEVYARVDGKVGASCASCHGPAIYTMKGVGARYPVYNKALKKPITLEQRINLCRTKHEKAPPLPWESRDLLALTIYIMNLSRGLPVNISSKGPLKPFLEKGRKSYYTRRGQLDMACAQCHERFYGNKFRQEILSQGHANGFPTYRLAWQRPGSLHRRFAGCNSQVRALPFAAGSEEYVNLELYVRWRGNGLPVETPAVRH